jgi:hypothetical protein
MLHLSRHMSMQPQGRQAAAGRPSMGVLYYVDVIER